MVYFFALAKETVLCSVSKGEVAVQWSISTGSRDAEIHGVCQFRLPKSSGKLSHE